MALEILAFETAIMRSPHGRFTISTDRARLDLDRIHAFLANESYWAKGMALPLVQRAIAGSLPFGAYDAAGALAGFARVVTDGAVFAYLRDVFVLEPYRGQGLARAMIQAALNHPDLKTVPNWMLSTVDAHAVYAAAGFRPIATPGNYMQLRRIPEEASQGYFARQSTDPDQEA